MDLKTSHARKSKPDTIKTQHIIEVNGLMSTETVNAWAIRSYAEAANTWGSNLGTADFPALVSATHNIGAVGELLTDQEYVVKSVRVWGSQQGTAGDRDIEFCIFYIDNFNIGIEVLKTNTFFYGAQMPLAKEAVTIKDDWSLTTKHCTNFNGTKIPKDALVFVSAITMDTGANSNNCSINASIVLEGCKRGGSRS